MAVGGRASVPEVEEALGDERAVNAVEERAQRVPEVVEALRDCDAGRDAVTRVEEEGEEERVLAREVPALATEEDEGEEDEAEAAGKAESMVVGPISTEVAMLCL